MIKDVGTLVLQTPEKLVPRKVIPEKRILPKVVGEFESLDQSVHETRLQEVLTRERESGYTKFLVTFGYHDTRGDLNAGKPGFLYEVKRAR